MHISLEQWKNAIACQIQKCSNWQQLEHLWNEILHDHTKHNSQYNDSVLPFLEKIGAIQIIQTLGADSLKTLWNNLAEQHNYGDIQLVREIA